MVPYFIELSAEGVEPVRLNGTAGSLSGLGIVGRGIEGWDSTPTTKVDAVARSAGDGGYDIDAGNILYASRTVKVIWAAYGDNRQSVHELTDSLRRFVHRLVTMRVVDGEQDTYCEHGYFSMDQASVYRHATTDASSFTIVFERPERLSTHTQRIQVNCPSNITGGGLTYNPDLLLTTLDGDIAIRYPLTYDMPGDEALTNTGLLHNTGTSRAYPVLTVCGDLPEGIHIAFPGTGLELACSRPINPAVPLVLDCRSRTASMGGTDISESLTKRGFPMIDPDGTLKVLTLTTTPTSAWIECIAHDTWM